MSAPVVDYTGHWADGDLPANVRLGKETTLTGDQAFKRFRSRKKHALTIGEYCTMDGVQFAVDDNGALEIGHYFYSTNVILRG